MIGLFSEELFAAGFSFIFLFYGLLFGGLFLAIGIIGKISAKKIIVATHFPLLNKHGAYFLKLYQHRSYVIALKNAQEVDGMYVDESKITVLGGGIADPYGGDSEIYLSCAEEYSFKICNRGIYNRLKLLLHTYRRTSPTNIAC